MISTQELDNCCLLALSCFIILCYFVPLAMSQKRNLRNLEDNKEVALLRLTVKFTSMSGYLRKHTEAFVRVCLEKVIEDFFTEKK